MASYKNYFKINKKYNKLNRKAFITSKNKNLLRKNFK